MGGAGHPEEHVPAPWSSLGEEGDNKKGINAKEEMKQRRGTGGLGEYGSERVAREGVAGRVTAPCSVCILLPRAFSDKGELRLQWN